MSNEDQIGELKRSIEEERREKRKKAAAYAKVWMARHPEHVKSSRRSRARRIKEEMIALKGGKCADCGGVFPPYAYDFHHTKFGGASPPNFVSLNRRRMLEELNKCVLLCAICHRGRHVADC